jgi:hypothetical protein
MMEMATDSGGQWCNGGGDGRERQGGGVLISYKYCLVVILIPTYFYIVPV